MIKTKWKNEADPAKLAQLGREIRDRRAEAKLGVRELARAVGISPQYLTILEESTPDKRPRPSPWVIRALAVSLEAELSRWLGLASYEEDEWDVDEVVVRLTSKQMAEQKYKKWQQPIVARIESAIRHQYVPGVGVTVEFDSSVSEEVLRGVVSLFEVPEMGWAIELERREDAWLIKLS